ncbi:VWA-like domain-containing protein [Bacillus mexicanus]|uniref:vWA domain-containing protein n=1 Tax=Bacillus mexicanus TaxID=2834415 RepID=UPI003D1A23EE
MLANDTLSQEKKKLLVAKTNEAINNNIFLIIQNHPFYAKLLSKFHLDTKVDETNSKCPVAAVSIPNGRPTRHTNPLGYLTYQTREQIFIDIHEILHITDLHHIRSKGKDHSLWNIACDIDINQRIESSIAILPKDALMYYHFSLPKGLSAEEYYTLLENREEPITLPPELSNTLLQDIINNMKNGNSDNKDSSSDGNSNSHSQNKAPGFENLHPTWGKESDLSDDIQKGIIKNMLSDVINSTGSIPGEMTGIIERLFEPQLDWPNLLSSFAQSLISTKKRYTWSRLSRKYGSLKMGTLRRKELNLLVSIDTSGSLDQKTLAQFLSEINAMKNYANITIVQCDADIQSVESIDEIDIDNFEVKGRGGTSFIPVFEFAAKKEIEGTDFTLQFEPDGVIYLTDGYGPAPDYSNIQTLWVLTSGGRKPTNSSNEEITWGNFVSLDQ